MLLLSLYEKLHTFPKMCKFIQCLLGVSLSPLRIDNSPFGPFWCRHSIIGTDISSLWAHTHNIFYLEAGFKIYLMV